MERYKRDHGDIIDAGQARYRATHKEKRYDEARTPHIRFSVAKYRAKKRNLDFTLSLDQYTHFIEQVCFYCRKRTFGVEVGGGLDRIDNKKGYVLGNVLACCGDCNTHRQDTWTVEETKAAILAVRKFRLLKFLRGDYAIT